MSDARKAADVLAYKLGCEHDQGKVQMIERALTDFADATSKGRVAIETGRLEARDAIAQRLREQGLHRQWADMVSALQPEHLVKK